MRSIVVGVLAFQGDFAKHLEMLRSLGVEAREVRTLEELNACDGLIIPGGESTVISRHLDFAQMRESVCAFAKTKPVFGTCAGLILMSSEIEASKMKPLKLLNVKIERNAFGRQIDSFQVSVEMHLNFAKPKNFRAFFIRAPRILETGKHVKVLARYNEEPILVQEGLHLGATFHPELTFDTSVHQYFLDLIRKSV